MQLVSLSDFVLEKNEFGLFKKNDDQIRKYAEFLQQNIKLSMFIDSSTNIKATYNSDAVSCKKTILEYEKTLDEKDKVIIFSDVEVRDLISNDIGIMLGGTTIFQIKTKYLDNEIKQYYKTIEDILFNVKVPIFIKLSF